MLKGMERWLSMDISSLLYDVGIWGNILIL